MGNKYGKSALYVTLTTPDLDKYLKKIQEAGNNIDEASKDAIDAVLPIVESSMKIGAERHRRTGAVVNAISSIPAKVTGNYVYGQVGIDISEHPEALHGVYQEYGDGHSPGFPDPFVAPAIFENRSEIRKIQRKILKKAGIPVD